MFDPQHLNALGNMVFGLDVLRLLGVQPLDRWKDICAEGMRVQAVLDRLE